MENTRQKDNQLPITYLRPARGWLAVDFGELWRYRELIIFSPGVISKCATNRRCWVLPGRFCSPY